MVGTLPSKSHYIFQGKDSRLVDERNHDRLVHQEQALKHFLETLLGRHFPMHRALVVVLFKTGMSFVLEFRLPSTLFPVILIGLTAKGRMLCITW